MIIRLLQQEDIAPAARIIGVNYSKKYELSSTLELKAMFGNGPILPTYYVAKENEVIIGVAGYIQSWMDYNIYQIFWVNVIPERQKQGIGKRLVAKLITQIKKQKSANLILLTADGTVKNHLFYKKHFGFKTLKFFDKKTYHLMGLSLEK